jgi:triacylglycerol esterase/lipase EstA (alpha/beta hydrolase family)
MRNIPKILEFCLLALAAVFIGSLSATIAAAGSFIIVGSVAGSYIIRRYEIENTAPSSFSRFRADPLERIIGMAGEAAAAFLCVFLYPFGLISGAHLPPLCRGERPLILCHGYMANRSSLLWLGRRLKRAGRRNVIIPNFRPASATVEEFAESLSHIVAGALEKTGAGQVDLIGHSMGGLVIRYYVERMGGAPFVHTAVTLGTPHRGTKTAALGLFKTADQFHPNARFIQEMQVSAPASGVKMVSVWSEFDNIVLPPENALLPEPHTNIMVKNVGHVALLFSRQALVHLRLAFTD